jgi:hypothetical protein
MSRRMKAALAAGVALLVLALGVTVGVIAAGGSSAEDRETGDTGGAFSERFERPQRPQIDPEVLEEFRDCLRPRGVELPEPGSGRPPDVDDERLWGAIEACRDELPADIRPPRVELQ